MLTRVPWWAKVGAKLFLAHIPVQPGTWQSLGLFRHGAMDDAAYSVGVFRSHVKRSGLSSLEGVQVLELGPGNSIATAVIAAAHGCTSTLVDAGDFASRDIGFYQRLAESLRAEGLRPPDLTDADSVGDVLEICGARYLTNGLNGLVSVASSSIDLVFSQAVLEHVRSAEFKATMTELNRILSPAGVSSHRVDLRDHLGGGLNNLRFAPGLWESRFFAESGFYTNRLSLSEMIAVFEMTHGHVNVIRTDRWESEPIRRRRLSRAFKDRTTEDLRVQGFNVVLKRGA